MLLRTDLHAEHHVTDIVVPIVKSLVQRTDAEHDVVVHRPVPSRPQLPDVIVKAGFLHFRAHAFCVDVLVVEVEDHLVLAPLQNGFQGRDLVRGHIAGPVHQVQSLNLLESVVFHLAFPVRCPVHSQIVHQNHHAVLGEAEIHLEERRHHRQRLLAGLHTVLRIARHHSSTMSADDDIPVRRVPEIFLQIRKRIDNHLVGGDTCL